MTQVAIPAPIPPSTAIAPRQEGDAIISMIERAARDPNVDVAKMERLFEMHEKAERRRASMAYAQDMAEMQPKMPVVDRRGTIKITKKDQPETVIQSTPYALWEDISTAIRPILAEHHFALTFRTGTTAEGRITVTGILCHAGGHSEETTITLQHDSTGSKNSVQAVGSSISYGKRYTAGLLLNIVSKGEDDDGKAAGDVTTEDLITEGESRAAAGVSALQNWWQSLTAANRKAIGEKELARLKTLSKGTK